MWMFYVQRSEIKDLTSGVEYLQDLFGDLMFDAEHEAIYGTSFFESDCMEVMQKYRNGVQYCFEYLNNDVKCVDCLIRRLCHCNLGAHAGVLKPFLPEHLHSLLDEEDDGEEDDGEEDDGEGEEKDECKNVL